MSIAEQQQPTVVAVVAGPGEPGSLEACLAGIAAQTHAVSDVISGNERFEDGMRTAHQSGAAWVWVLHDDAVPDPTALEELLAATVAVPEYPPPALVVAKPVRPDGSLADALLPRPDFNRVERSMAAYAKGLQALRFAGFTCALVGRAAIDAEGLPDPSLGPRAAELEYSARVMRSGTGYLAPKAVVRTSAEGGLDGQPVGAYVADSVRMLRSGSWKLGESIGLGVGRGAGALKLLRRR